MLRWINGILPFEFQWLKTHAADRGSGVVEFDAFVVVASERDVGVAEIAVDCRKRDFDGAHLSRMGAPTEVESIAIEDKRVATLQPNENTRQHVHPDGARGHEVQIGDHETAHGAATEYGDVGSRQGPWLEGLGYDHHVTPPPA